MRHGSVKCWIYRALAFLLLAVYCLLTVSLVSCGRRGDPVFIAPYEENGAADTSEVRRNKNEKSEPAPGRTAEEKGPNGMPPQAPTGLSAIFTGEKIILVWNEVSGQGVKFYRIYRSEGEGFNMIGEAATPVFNDRDIVSGARYFYKVSAVGQSESSGSSTVEVAAGGD
jgi:predicted small lipoprotein YifL